MAEGMPQMLACANCKKRYLWKPEYAGKRVRCSNCGEVLQMPAGRPASTATPCPACGAPCTAGAAFCGNCGTSLETGPSAGGGGPRTPAEDAMRLQDPVQPAPHVPPVAVSATPVTPAARRKAKSISLGKVLSAPFHADLAAQALLIVLGAFGWMVLLFASLSLALVVGIVLGPLAIPLVFIAVVGVPVAFIGWVAKQYLATAEQYECGAMVADINRTKLQCLGMFLVVSLIAWAPAAILVQAMPGDPSAIYRGEFLVLSVWGVLYWPMGIAMAGAYGTLHPVKVVEKVLRTFPAYLAVLAVLAPFVAVAHIVGAFAAMPLVKLLPSLLGAFSGWIVAAVLAQYGLVGAFAMLGALLRKYRSPEQPT